MSSVTGAGEERANFAAAATPTGEVGSSERRVIAGKVCIFDAKEVLDALDAHLKVALEAKWVTVTNATIFSHLGSYERGRFELLRAFSLNVQMHPSQAQSVDWSLVSRLSE